MVFDKGSRNLPNGLGLGLGLGWAGLGWLGWLAGWAGLVNWT